MFRSFICLALLFCAGCTKSDPLNRVHVQGTVNFKGSPVVAGLVLLEPDKTKGNSGPQGYAVIIDGKFDSKENNGKPVLQGPLLVRIQGFDGQNRSELQPYGSPVFRDYKTNIEVSAENTTFNFEVP